MSQSKIIVNGTEYLLGSEGTSSVLYSTAETKIGKWISGKPLYRMTIDHTFPTSITASSSGFQRDIVTIPNIDVVTKMRGMFKTSDTGRYRDLPYMGTGDNYFLLFVIQSSGRFYYSALFSEATAKQFSGASGFFIIEYTKTTD